MSYLTRIKQIFSLLPYTVIFLKFSLFPKSEGDRYCLPITLPAAMLPCSFHKAPTRNHPIEPHCLACYPAWWFGLNLCQQKFTHNTAGFAADVGLTVNPTASMSPAKEWWCALER